MLITIMIIKFQQQYSPMVMRKFKRPEDAGVNGFDGLSDDQLAGLNSPRMSRRNRGGSFSGQAVQDSSGPGFDSPSVRRRRSRIPSEEDDKLVTAAVIVSVIESNFTAAVTTTINTSLIVARPLPNELLLWHEKEKATLKPCLLVTIAL